MAQPLMCTCFLKFAFSSQHAGRGFSVLLMFKSTGSSAQERKNSHLFHQEECLLCEQLFSEKVPERTLCSVFVTPVSHSFDHTVLTDPSLILPPVIQIYLLSWKFSALLRAVCVLGMEMQFCKPSVASLWLAMSTKVFWSTFIITKWVCLLF